MPPSPDSTTDTYLDVLRTLGVPDAALERHHDAGPETPLRVAIDGDRGAPTADLLSALDATGRLLDLREGITSDDGDRLTASLARFGLRIECAAEEESEALALRVTDDVTGETERITTESDADAILATLREELPGADGIGFVELLDGRHLVATPRELETLAARYGPRIQPYDDPLLVPDDAIETTEQKTPSGADSTSTDPDLSAADPSPSAESASPTASGSHSPSKSASASAQTSAPSPSSDGDGESFGEFVSSVDESAAEAVESALSSGGSKTHTIEGDGEDVAAASSATVGGGPKRTVSTSGIDDVFDHLESSASDDDPPAATTETMSESSDPPTDPTASSDDAHTTPNGLTGGPTRTVSTKSADDILEQATGGSDFETIAEEEGDADPDAVLADADDVPPALEDADVADAPASDPDDAAPNADERSSTSPDSQARQDADEPAADADEPTAETDEPVAEADEPVGAADVPPADPAAVLERETATEQEAEEPIAVAPGGSEPTAPTDVDVDAEAPTVEESDVDDAGDDAETESTLPDGELLEDDVELRRGNESVGQPVAPATESVDVDPEEPGDADGPLAAAGGVPRADSPDGSSADDGSVASNDGASPAAGTGSQQSTAEAGDPSGEPDASAADGTEIEESAAAEDDPGLVGRITSTIFGR